MAIPDNATIDASKFFFNMIDYLSKQNTLLNSDNIKRAKVASYATRWRRRRINASAPKPSRPIEAGSGTADGVSN
jgi:hypothetical protein